MVFMRANFGVTEQTLRRQKLSNIQLSELNASGFTHTSTDLYEYLKHLVVDIKKKLPCESTIEAYLWSYRHSGYYAFSRNPLPITPRKLCFNARRSAFLSYFYLKTLWLPECNSCTFAN